MRRRLRRQQRIREALLLDLGALVFELHRHGRREPELLQAKAAELSTVDEEVRSLAEALKVGYAPQLVAPGIAGSCPNCGGLLTTDDRFCSSCGTATGRALEAEPPKQAATGLDVNEGLTTETDLPREEHEVLEPVPEEEPEPEPEPEEDIDEVEEVEDSPQPFRPSPPPPPPPPPPAPSPRDADLFEDVGRAVQAGIRRGRTWMERRRR
jgi:zinc ribbon protein